MKTKMIISAVIFIGIFFFLKETHLIGIDRLPFDDYPQGLGKSWIMFYLIICPATICAAIPFAPEIIKKMFGRSWEQ